VLVELPNGSLTVRFNDWTPAMIALACALAELPAKPGGARTVTGRRTYPLGIDALRTRYRSDVAVRFVWEAIVAGDLTQCPDAEQIVALGDAAFEARRALDSVVQQARKRSKYGFVRRNRTPEG